MLSAGCPRCASPLADLGALAPVGSDGQWACPEHGPITPMWRPGEASYEAFAEHLEVSAGFPTHLPWPLSPGWSVTDFAAVSEAGRTRATMACVSGTSEDDGPVDVLLVLEEPGTGLGARCAGTRHDDPGAEVGEGPPAVRVQLDRTRQPVGLWSVSTSADSAEWDRSVVAGEAGGRWLWIVLRPASAVLLLREEWKLRDVSGLGPSLVEVPFGGPPPAW